MTFHGTREGKENWGSGSGFNIRSARSRIRDPEAPATPKLDLALGHLFPDRIGGMNETILRTVFSLALAAGFSGLAAGAAEVSSATNPPTPPPRVTKPELPQVCLEAKDPIVSDRRGPCSVEIVLPKGGLTGLSNQTPAIVRLHGASSQGFPKKSFSFSLDTPASLLAMNPNRHWLLNAAYIDRSLMRHKLAYDLFRSLSRPGHPRFAAESRFVELKLNGSYQGVYLLMEHVDRQRLRFRSYHSNDFSHACIYKARDHGANFAQPGHVGYEQREPDPAIHPSYWKPVDDLDSFVSTVPDSDFFHPQTGLESRLDVDNAMDFHLLVLLTSNADGVDKNFYLACDGQETEPQRQRFLFVPWDYDGTFGRNWDASPFPVEVWLSIHLFDRLLGNAAYRERFLVRWKQLRAREFSLETIQRMTDENARTLGAAVRRNEARWPTTGWPYPDRVTFEEDLAQMRRWTEARLKWLDQYLQGEFGKR